MTYEPPPALVREWVLPTAAFAEDIDDMPEALGTLDPVILQPVFNFVGISCDDPCDDAGVFFY